MLLTAVLLSISCYRDAFDDRVEAAVRKLSLERKLEMIGGYEGFDIMPVPELGLHKILMNDGPLGVRGDNESRPAMAYPAGVCLASTFNPVLFHEFGTAVGRDALGRGVGILLGPGVNLSRIVQNGRNFEYMGEDPFVASRCAVGMIEGLQGQGVVATVKHYAANNHENDRFRDSSDVSERAMRELYLRAFEASVKEAHVGAVMCSYNKLNGVYASENAWLLKDVLRHDWGFNGILMSDWGAVHSTEGAALNGMDLEMPSGRNFDPKMLRPLVTDGKVPEAVIDGKIRHILHTIYEFHLDGPLPKAIHDDPRNAAVARRIAEEGIVLLQNNRKTLPINPAKGERIAVMGFNALSPVPVAGGSAEIVPLHQESLLDAMNRTGLRLSALRSKDPDVNAALSFNGYTRVETDFSNIDGKRSFKRIPGGSTTADWTDSSPSPVGMGSFRGQVVAMFRPKTSGAYWLVSKCQGGVRVGIGWSHSVVHDDIAKPTVLKQMVFLTAGKDYDLSARFNHTSGDIHIAFGILPAASPLTDPKNLAALKAADKVVIGVGFNPYLESEGTDRPFQLPQDQQELIRAAILLKKRVILVVNSGAGVDLAPFAHDVDSIVQAWYAGEEGATALAEILTGKINPSGKLAASFPKSLAGTYYADAYPPKNGHVAYSEDLLIGYRWFDTKGSQPLFPFGFGLSYTTFKISRPRLTVNSSVVSVSAAIQNTGAREGADVVQTYVGPRVVANGFPLKELKAFHKLSLRAGGMAVVTMKIPVTALAHWNTADHRWHVAKGEYFAYVGDSSQGAIRIPFRIAKDTDYLP
ncbi:MAG: glycoside hydrolase family 3 C-terminal domain-containing protein [Fimbriimonas sp.]|nr:glycoside hydrolase family 3 C-terminal domain-containing protein [Fimbriimonas sp.]